MIPIGDAAASVVSSVRKQRLAQTEALCREIVLVQSGYRRPLGEYGWRQMLAWIACFGSSEPGRSVNWDLDPVRWGMEHELQAAGRVVAGLTHDAIEAAE